MQEDILSINTPIISRIFIIIRTTISELEIFVRRAPNLAGACSTVGRAKVEDNPTIKLVVRYWLSISETFIPFHFTFL